MRTQVSPFHRNFNSILTRDHQKISQEPILDFFYFFFEGLHSQKNKTLKNFKVKSKENKISHGRGNSLRNKVRGWVDLDSPDHLNPLPTG